MKGFPGIVILVCCSEHFTQIPVGTIGLSDRLSRSGISHEIFHSHLQPSAELKSCLEQKIKAGWHVSMVLHWKENTETFCRLAIWLRSITNPHQLSCGGITASFFYKEILTDPSLPDLVFRGDPEEPILNLCEGVMPGEIPNLSWLKDQTVIANPMTYSIDNEGFENARFANYHKLHRSEQYIKKTNALFIHIPISRGCWANCNYCGGSQLAYKLHSARSKVLIRKPERVVHDVEELFHKLSDELLPLHLHFDDFYRNYRPILEVLSQHSLAPQINLYISERGYLAPERILKDRELFTCFNRVTFELSPETEDDAMRSVITRGSGKEHYNEDTVRRIIRAGEEAGINLWIYYSVFNTLDTSETLSARFGFLDKMYQFLTPYKNSHLIIHSLALDCASDAYLANSSPPTLSEYRKGSGRFSMLLGNLTLAEDKDARIDLMTCKFFMEAMRDQDTYRMLRKEIRMDYSCAREIVSMNRWDEHAFSEDFDSVYFLASMVTDLSSAGF
ncbi:MAG: hypothetical protein GY761_10360 [Hyphomicrobiales bacterium]|nr:hypothetical protein [Hyphomicrobiales bacterium]